MAVLKQTFSLDEATTARLDRVARRLVMPKSQVVREALRAYEAQVDRLDETERRRLLDVLDGVLAQVHPRSEAEVDRELEEIRSARRAGGRQHP